MNRAVEACPPRAAGSLAAKIYNCQCAAANRLSRNTINPQIFPVSLLYRFANMFVKGMNSDFSVERKLSHWRCGEEYKHLT
jgi:hypothetical protein